eukprot:4612703-Alexandrium_andersonii.AAC.1
MCIRDSNLIFQVSTTRAFDSLAAVVDFGGPCPMKHITCVCDVPLSRCTISSRQPHAMHQESKE